MLNILGGGRWARLVVLGMGLALSATPASAEPMGADPVVTTVLGTVRGKVSDDGAVEVFKGIPFAAPPVGELRWKAPQPPIPWSGVLDAGKAGSACPQTGRSASTTEDCLFLNVWRAHGKPHNALPVMVYLHGGGQRQGEGDNYKLDWLVTRGAPVIAVTINFRLNIFAFFAHKALTAEQPELGSGNAAMLDQIAALKWVRANIRRFGGDPDKVTIFGESGGAQAVCLLLASPPAHGLFQRAITQSGPCQWQFYSSLSAAEERGVQDAASLGCTEKNPMPCLRALPAGAVLARERGAQKDTAGAQPAWGGGAFPLPMREAMASGRFNRVPVMQGSTGQEAVFELSMRYDGAGKVVTPAQYPAILAEYFGPSRVAAIEKRYPLASYSTPFYALVAALTDSGMVTNNRIGLCNMHLANQLLSPHVPLYSFVFADQTAASPYATANGPRRLPGAGHGNDLAYLFHFGELSDAQRKISDAMIAYWTNFAAKGDPNGPGLPPWPAYQPEQQMVMKFMAEKVAADTDLYVQSQCKFWNELGYAVLAGPYPTPSSTDAAVQ
jgi:para-nitrobenzyl esterase